MGDCQNTDSSSVLVQARKIVRIYGQGAGSIIALNEASIVLNRGELVVLSGPSGSGKTTLLNILGCLDQPTGGSLFFNGIDTAGLSRNKLAELRNKQIGFVFQQFNLLPKLTALENVMLPSLIAGKLSDKTRAIYLLNEVGLGDRIDHLPSELSGGEQQRVAIARALIREPVLILADEPTGNLDRASGENIMRILCGLVSSQCTVVIATHQPETVPGVDQHISIIDGHLTVQ